MTNPEEVLQHLAAERERAAEIEAKELAQLKKSQLDVRWFTDSRHTIGIVRTCFDSRPEPEKVKYYIGVCVKDNSEIEDIAHIAAYGANYPKVAGDVLFEVIK